MLLFDRLPFYIGIVIILLSALVIARRKKNYSFLFFYGLFTFYLLNVIKYTLFPIPIDPRVIAIHAGPTIDFMKGMNFIPFNYTSIGNLFSRQVVLNVLLAIPFGFGIPFLTRIDLKKIIILGALFGVIIELLQLSISLMLGFPYRYVDINDVINNFTGAILGFLFFKIFSRLFIVSVDKLKITRDSFTEYIYNICSSSIRGTAAKSANR